MKEREAKNKEKNNNIFQKASEDQISEGKLLTVKETKLTEKIRRKNSKML